MEEVPTSVPPKARWETYRLTRFIMLRWLGLVYLFAFYAAARQLVPLIGANGLTPAPLFLQEIIANHHLHSKWDGFAELPSLFWIDCSDTALQVVPWIGVVLSCFLLAGFANMPMMAALWILYMSIVHVGQSWYGFGWEIQLLETGFLAIFLCPPLDARPFPRRPAPLPVIFLFRWLIVRIMLGSALIKLRGDDCWRDFTALYTFFETQPIPNPFSRWFHFLPHFLLQFGVFWTYVVELISPWFVFWPRWGRIIAGALIVSFQSTLIISGNFSFFNFLTILPALACFDDRFWQMILPGRFIRWADKAPRDIKPGLALTITAWVLTGLIALLSIQPTLNLISPPKFGQVMNGSYDPFELVNTYGAFGTVGKEADVLIFEGSAGDDPNTATDWKEYRSAYLPGDPARGPSQIAPYQPHLDWALWFAAQSEPPMTRYANDQMDPTYWWTLNLAWKLLHNDPAILGLFADNPFPDHPPRYVRAILYVYHFAPPGNPAHVYWTRDRVGIWLGPYSVDSPELLDVLRTEGWIPQQ